MQAAGPHVAQKLGSLILVSSVTESWNRWAGSFTHMRHASLPSLGLAGRSPHELHERLSVDLGLRFFTR